MWIILPVLGFFVAFEPFQGKPFDPHAAAATPIDPKYLAKLARRTEKRARLDAYYAAREVRYQNRTRLLDWLRR